MVVERFIMKGPDDFQRRLHVASREGQSINQKNSELNTKASQEKKQNSVVVKKEETTSSVTLQATKQAKEQHPRSELDDSDMVVIEEDRYPEPNNTHSTVAAVRTGDYSRLFARLRRGGRMESSS